MRNADYIIQRRKEKWEQDHNIIRDKEFREAVALAIVQDETLRKQFVDNPEKLIEAIFIIVDKEKNTVPFFFNEVQQDFIDTLNKAIDDYNNRLITEIALLILKGRQQGFTTLITAYQLANIILRKNFEGFTVADEADNAEAIFENKAKYPYSQLPECIKPTEKYNNRRQLLFEKLNSSWAVEVATKQIGRSRTINFLHASEGAFWKYGIAVTQASLGEALTKSCIKIYESTANGMNDYYDMWQSGVYINCFYAWWKTSEYSLNFESEETKKTFISKLDSKEWIYERIKWLLEQGLTYEQCYWYYKKYESYLDKELIKQEYPCSPDEAFLMSGRPVFNLEKVIRRIEELKRKCPYKQGHFYFEWNNPDIKDFIKDDTIKFVEGDGIIKIYEERKEGYPYVIGGDTKGEGKDFYTGTVINNATGNRVATLRMQLMESKPFTHQMYCLGRYYNNALIGVEMNWNTAPIEELERLKYPNQYVRQKYDDFTKTIQKKFGWRTDGNTRPLIIDKEVGLIENNIELFNDLTMLNECLTFVYDKNNRPDAMPGKHDDQLFSDMIANEIRGQQSYIFKNPEEQKAKWRADQFQDYYQASETDKKMLLEAWGNPF